MIVHIKTSALEYVRLKRSEVMGKAFDNWLEKAKVADEKIHPGNILMPGGMTAEEFQNILTEDILGPDWYIEYSCNDDQARAETAAAILAKFNKHQSLIGKIVSKVRTWIKEELHITEQYRKQKLEAELALARKCAKCKSRDCIWTSGYCPN